MLRRLTVGLFVQLAAVAGTVAVLLWGVLHSRFEKMILLNAPEFKTYAWVCSAVWLVAFAVSQFLQNRPKGADPEPG